MVVASCPAGLGQVVAEGGALGCAHQRPGGSHGPSSLRVHVAQLLGGRLLWACAAAAVA